MFEFAKTKRSPSGDLTLPFLGFVLVGALTIATLTGLSQYNIMSEKLNTALQEGKTAAISHIQNNLNDSALIGSPSPATTAALNQARFVGINAAKLSLGEKIQEELLVRNPSGGSDLNIFDSADTFVRAASDGTGTVEIQFSVDAQLLSNVPINYQRSTEMVKARPSSFNSQCLELSCSTNCGECGACDTCTGSCIPKFDVADGQGGFKIPDTENSSPDDIVCKLAAPQDICQAEGWNNITEDGIDGCELNGCKFIPNHTAWNINGSFAKVYFENSLISTTTFASATQFDSGGKTYKRDQEFPSDNQDSPGSKNYAVCREQLSRRIFVSSQTFTGNLIQEAQAYGASTSDPVLAANTICTSIAAGAGMQGSWSALLGYYNTNRSAKVAAPNLREYYTPKDNATGDFYKITKPIFGTDDLWNGILRPINIDENGNEISPGITWFVWSGFKSLTSNSYVSQIGDPGRPLSSDPFAGLSERYFVSGDNGPNAWLRGVSATCDDWSSADTNQAGWYGWSKNSSSISGPDAIYSLIITGYWGELAPSASSCSHENHLYCVEDNETDTSTW